MAGMTVGGGDAASQIREHTYQEVVQDVRVCVQILLMKGSCIVWVGGPQASFASLDVAMKTHMDDVPVASALMGGEGDSPGSAIAKRLSMRFGLQAFVSFNLPAAQPLLLAVVEKRLLAEMQGLLGEGKSG